MFFIFCREMIFESEEFCEANLQQNHTVRLRKTHNFSGYFDELLGSCIAFELYDGLWDCVESALGGLRVCCGKSNVNRYVVYEVLTFDDSSTRFVCQIGLNWCEVFFISQIQLYILITRISFYSSLFVFIGRSSLFYDNSSELRRGNWRYIATISRRHIVTPKRTNCIHKTWPDCATTSTKSTHHNTVDTCEVSFIWWKVLNICLKVYFLFVLILFSK